MNVLLVATYAADRQYSLLGFAGALQRGLTQCGVTVKTIAPRAILGRAKLPKPLGKWAGHFDKLVLFPRELQRAAAAADIVHLCDHGLAIYTKHLQNVPHVVTCNDLIAMKAAAGELPEWNPGGASSVFQTMIRDGLHASKHIVVISEATRADVLRLIRIPPERVTRIYDALFQDFAPIPQAESLSLISSLGLDVNAPFLLHVGRGVPTKNRSGVIRILAALRQRAGFENLTVVLAGKELTEVERSVAAETKLSSVVFERNHVDDAQMQALYSRAEALLFPSFYEGFGLPIIEAQACSCPVFTSNRAPMTEVGGDAAVYVDPASPTDAARTIAEHWDKRPTMAAAGLENVKRFALSRMIDDYLEVYQRVLSQ